MATDTYICVLCAQTWATLITIIIVIFLLGSVIINETNDDTPKKVEQQLQCRL